MSDDAEWLRERPEIVERFKKAFHDEYMERMAKTASWPSEELCGIAGVLAILPLLRAAIRADVVRELAGDVDGVRDRAAAYLVEHGWQANAVLGCIDFITRERAAAHARGRAVGREEAAGDIEDADPQLAEFIRKRSRT